MDMVSESSLNLSQMFLLIRSASIKKWFDMMAPILPKPSHSTSRSVFLTSLTPTAVKILNSYAEKIPDGVIFGTGNFFCFWRSN
jgi:hypothetical protein